MFTFESTVRFSETDTSGHLSLGNIINYFQDCSEFHSQSLGCGVEHMENNAWILSSWQIILNRLPKRNEHIIIGTMPIHFKGIEGHRNFLIQDESYKTLIAANSIWTFFDLARQRPVRINERQYELYHLEEPYPMTYLPRKIDLKDIDRETYETISEYRVQHSMLDLFGHMNNSQHAVLAADSLPSDYTYNQIRIEYKQQAKLSDRIFTKRKLCDERAVICLENESGTVFAVTEFSTISQLG